MAKVIMANRSSKNFSFSILLMAFCLSWLIDTGQAAMKILCLGDSLTQSYPGYRGELFVLLTKGGYEFEFVGPKNGKVPDGATMNHGGYGGFTIGPGPSKADEWTNGKGNISAILDQSLECNPDVILLLVGTNEFFNIGDMQPGLNPNVDGPVRLAALVDKIRSLRPEAKILVGSVPPVGWDENFASGFNKKAAGLLAGKPDVWFVNSAGPSGFVKGDWSADNLHPSPSGYRKLAEAWYEALSKILKPKPSNS